MENTVRIMTDLIASEVCGKALDRSEFKLSDEELRSLYKLSKSHDLAHIVGDALVKNDLIGDGEIKDRFKNQIMVSFYRYGRMNYELNRLKKVLNEAKIPYVPLKGALIRDYYPEPWMRTSCDIDILVHEEQVGNAARIIVDKLGYTCDKNSYHDISMKSDSGVHLELHHSIKECKDNIDSLLAECWSYASVYEDFEYRFSNEFFLFHQFAHASYHFLGGGCGVRPFIDIFLLERKLGFDREALDDMLEKTGIKKFAYAASDLSAVWFGDGSYNDVTRRVERFIISGGVYGNADNSMAVSQQTEKGRIGYVLHRIWLPYEMLCTVYPRLRGRRILQPAYEVKRWFRIFDPKARKRKSRDLSAIGRLQTEKKEEVNRMVKELGLM